MRNLPIDAHINLEDGAYYNVRLCAIPRIGETINLYSLVDEVSGHKATHLLRVTDIQDEVHDIPAGAKEPAGKHFVVIATTNQPRT